MANAATWASGSGRQMPRSAVDVGRCRAPQQGLSGKWTIWEDLSFQKKPAAPSVSAREPPLVQHLHPSSNSNERSQTSTYGAKIMVCANKKAEWFIHSVLNISISLCCRCCFSKIIFVREMRFPPVRIIFSVMF